MKTKHARRGRAFDRMPSGVVMTMFVSTAKVHTLFGTAKRFRLLFCRRSHFDNECHSECAFLAAFWTYSNGLSLNVLRGSPRLSPAKRLPFWTCFGRIRQKAPCFRWKVGGFLGKGVGFCGDHLSLIFLISEMLSLIWSISSSLGYSPRSTTKGSPRILTVVVVKSAMST